MKKIICFFISILFLGCSQSTNMFLGVGQALDAQAPKISITSPENGVYVNKSDITITGMCSDNVGVTRIRAEAGINETVSVVTEEIKFPSVKERSWSVTFKQNDLDRILNLWRSGLKVTFTFTCYDSAGNTTIEHLFLYVDVEKPTVIINRPEVRFTEAEKIRYEKDVESFKKDYDINKFEKVNSFVNKEFIIKGYVDDDYSVKSTYINIYNSTKKKQVGVTPVIFKDGTFIVGGSNGEHDGVTVTGNSQSWEFKLDSTLFCPTEGWYVLEVVTEDEAGNEKRQFVDKDWIYINQAADIPKNNFTSFNPGFKLNAGNMIAGNGFDDDGMKEVWIKIVPESESAPDQDKDHTGWVECETPNSIVKRCADFAVGGQLGNWSVKVPSKAGNYIIYAVPVDINGVAPQAPYEGIYTSYFSVASEEDPVVGIDGQFRGATIVEKTTIKGHFYDNNAVTKMNVTITGRFDDKDEKIIDTKVLYDIAESIQNIRFTPDPQFQLSTGQIVTKYDFEWDFIPSDYMAHKTLSLTFRVDDEDSRYGEDAITIYGDSERPSFVGEITPANNSDVKGTNIFSGKVADNVGVVKVIIKKNSNNSNENTNTLSWECAVSAPVKNDGKYESTFKSDNVYPNDFGGYIDSEFTITAIDAAGNEANHIIFLKGDKNKAQIDFYDENGEKQKSGSYATKDKIINIRITPRHFEDDTYRKISQVSYSLDGKTEKSLELGQYSGGYYSIPLKVSDLGENVSGDVTLQIKAIDVTNNDSQGTLYFIVDNEAPNGLSITSPLLKDKTFIEGLTNTAANISENDISYYQNQGMTLKGTISDNYKINETVLDFYNAEGKSKIHSVTLTYDEEGKLSVSEKAVSGDKKIITAYSGIPGNFTLEIDTKQFDDGNYLLKTTAYDAAGNSTVWGAKEDVELEDYYFKVLQDADIPRITYNVDFDSDGRAQIFPGTTLKGAVVDDDAVAVDGVRYICKFKEELTIAAAEALFKDNKVQSVSNIKSFTRQNWEINDFTSNGHYYLYMQAEDKNGTKSKIDKRTITVVSTDTPYIESITASKGNGGKEYNEYYNGNINVKVVANGGGANLDKIMFRITSSEVDATDDIAENKTPAETFDFGTPAEEELGEWHEFIFANKEEPRKENIILSFDSNLFVKEKSETITVEVKCFNTDGGDSQVVKEKIAIDKEGPILRITTPVKDASINREIDIQGSANDKGSGVDKVYVSYQKTPTTLSEGNWSELTLDGISWNGEFDSWEINNTSDPCEYNLTIAASDKLGNIGYATVPVKIDQDGDRPIVRLQNLDLSLSADNTIWHKSGFIYGTISDDDGEVRSVQISENGVLKADDEKWGKNLYSNGSWEYKFDKDGEKTLAFKVVDSIGTTFISADNSGLTVPNLTVPKIIDSTGIPKPESIFTITVDTESPEMTDVYFNAEPNTKPNFPTSKDVDTSAWSNSFSEKTFGGTEKKMWFLIGGTDENGIASCTLTATDKDSGVDIPATNDPDRIKPVLINGTSFYKYEIDILKVTLTSLNFKIVMEDNSGLTTQKSFTVNIDNTAPTVNITSHSDGNSVYGTESNTIKGIVGEKDSTVEYALTGVKNGSVVEPSAGDYIEIGNSSNWEIVFNRDDDNSLNDNSLNSKIKNLYNVTGEFEDSYDLYVWLKATDKYGNVSDPKKVRLVVLPNGDKPKVSIDYPKNPEAGKDPNVLGGRITISGDTEIATNNVKEVYIQIYPSNAENCDFADFAENWETMLGENASDESFTIETDSKVSAVRGIKVTSSSKTSWRLNINGNKTMSSGLVAIKAIAVSDTDKYTESEIVVFRIDKEIPQFTDLKLVQYKDGVAVKTLEYKDEMWVSGKGWYLECMIEDDSGIDSDTIKKGDKVIEDGYLESLDNKRYKVKVPLAIIGDQYGQDSFTLYGTDMDGKQGEKNFIINFDNKAPDFYLDEDWNDYEIKDKKNDKKKDIENSPTSGLSTISGEFKEEGNQSGFERIAMYFTRKVGEKTYIIDPMLEKGDKGDGNRYDVNKLNNAGEKELIYSDGMYWREVEATINNGEITLSDSDSVPDNVRKGGLVKVSGAIYRINDISGKQIVVSGNPDTEATKAYFAIAQVIDNLTIEIYNRESDSITYDDGDKMVEGVYRTTGTYDWTVSINTANIFDGDVDVHFVAFDKAGNVTKKTYQGKVKNNNPRIAGVLFGTDKNGDGKIEEGKREWVTSFENIYDASKTEAEGCLDGVTVNGKDANSKKITNLKLPLEGDKALMTIKDSIKVNAKVVGGNTNLQWQWKIEDKIGDFDWSGLKKFKDEGVVGSSYGDVIRTNLPMMEITMLDFLKAKKNGVMTGVGNLSDKTLSIRIWDETEGTTVGVDSQYAEINVVVNTILQDDQAPTVTITPFYWNSATKNSLYQNSRANGHIELEGDLPSGTFKNSSGIYDTDPKVSGKITIEGTAKDNVLLKELLATIKYKDGNGNDVAKEFTMATYENGSWKSDGNMNKDGWACEVETDETEENDHKVNWKLHLDTEKIANVTAKDVTVSVSAKDRGKASVSDDKVVYDGMPNTSKEVSCQMDVVPYITDVKTMLWGKKKQNQTVYSRTAQGHYPVSTKETIELIGFNLGTNTKVNVSTLSSGLYEVEVNGIKTLNNINNNNACGENKNPSLADRYNMQPNSETNNTLTDDIYFDVWEINTKAAQAKSGKIKEPVMRINPNNNMIGFAFANGSDLFSMPNGNSNSYTIWQKNYANYTGINFVYGSDGRAHSLSTGLDTQPSDEIGGRLQYINSAWGENGEYIYNWNTDVTVSLESIGAQPDTYIKGEKQTSLLLDTERFSSPSIAVAGSNRTYIAYYDKFNEQIRFVYGTSDSSTNGGKSVTGLLGNREAENGTIGNDSGKNNRGQTGVAYDRHDVYESSSSSYSVVAGIEYPDNGTTPTDTKNIAGEHLSLAVIPGDDQEGDVVVFVWYDGTNLNYTYRYGEKGDVDAKSSGVDGKWSKTKQIFTDEIGEHCAVTVDANDGIHIAAYSRSGADLYYAYLSNKDATPKTCLVDSYSQIGKYISIDVALKSDTEKTAVPYISYFAEGFSGLPKVAYLPEGISDTTEELKPGSDDSTDMFTGTWEVSLIPTSSYVCEDNMNVAVWKKNGVIKKSIAKAVENKTPTTSGTCYGNGTSQFVLGYATEVGVNGYIETAQMK